MRLFKKKITKAFYFYFVKTNILFETKNIVDYLLLISGIIVEFEVRESGLVEVWIGGKPQPTPKDVYENILTWCKLCTLPKDITLNLVSISTVASWLLQLFG